MFKTMADFTHRWIYRRFSNRRWYPLLKWRLHDFVNTAYLSAGIFVKGYSMYFIYNYLKTSSNIPAKQTNTPAIFGDFLNHWRSPVSPPMYVPHELDTKVT